MRNLANASQRVLEAASDQPIRRIPRQAPPLTEREFIAQERRKAHRRTALFRRVRRAEKAQG